MRYGAYGGFQEVQLNIYTVGTGLYEYIVNDQIREYSWLHNTCPNLSDSRTTGMKWLCS